MNRNLELKFTSEEAEVAVITQKYNLRERPEHGVTINSGFFVMLLCSPFLTVLRSLLKVLVPGFKRG